MSHPLKETSLRLRGLGLTGPAVVLDGPRAHANIRSMADRAAAAGARFRPHFKTHQSGAVGKWFAEQGVQAITVSSLGMAEYFAEFGWTDITLAFLLNPLELPRLATLAHYLDSKGGRLGVTLDSVEVAGRLADARLPVRVWIKTDTGYRRSGVAWDNLAGLGAVASALGSGADLAGLLSHTGHSYGARNRETLQAIWDSAVERMTLARSAFGPASGLALSLGDTPCCATVNSLAGVDEIRPGNFVFFDLMQREIGSCRDSDLAVAVACPVVGVYPDVGRLVLQGGAVHLSKEFLGSPESGCVFGYLGTLDSGGRSLGKVLEHLPVTSVSQEHGVISVGRETYGRHLNELAIGDLVLVWPVHSCLSCDLHRQYHTLDGQVLPRR